MKWSNPEAQRRRSSSPMDRRSPSPAALDAGPWFENFNSPVRWPTERDPAGRERDLSATHVSYISPWVAPLAVVILILYVLDYHNDASCRCHLTASAGSVNVDIWRHLLGHSRHEDCLNGLLASLAGLWANGISDYFMGCLAWRCRLKTLDTLVKHT